MELHNTQCSVNPHFCPLHNTGKSLKNREEYTGVREKPIIKMNKQLKNPVTKWDHIIGTKTALLQLLEYGDYQCPSCSESHLVIKEILKQMGENVAFVFRNFPLTDIHLDAFDAALAAEAAALQNKFWEMHDLLYQNQANLRGHELFYYARQIGLDMNRFEQDIQRQALFSKIEADMEGGLKSGVTGTPTFYINGEKYEREWESNGLADTLKTLLEGKSLIIGN